MKENIFDNLLNRAIAMKPVSKKTMLSNID